MGQLLLLVNISILLYTLVFQTYFYIILSLDKALQKDDYGSTHDLHFKQNLQVSSSGTLATTNTIYTIEWENWMVLKFGD